MSEFLDPKPRKRKTVMKQDDYLHKLKDIIGKQYFPDRFRLQKLDDLLDADTERNEDVITNIRMKHSHTSKPFEEQRIKKRQKPDELNAFLKSHSSEDNERFIEIQEEARLKHREKNWWACKPQSYLTLENPKSSLRKLNSEDSSSCFNRHFSPKQVQRSNTRLEPAFLAKQNSDLVQPIQYSVILL